MSSLATTKNNGSALSANVLEREEFGAREMMRRAERSAVAAAAQAKAEVESRYVVAMQNPRDLDQVRVELLNDCNRPAFAKAARYKIPNRGEGWTIRFAEAAGRRMRNLYIPAFVIYDDDETRIMRVTATDLEGNVTWPKDVTISKTIERYDGAGREVVRTRITSTGKTIYIVRATDEEMMVKEGALISKAARTNTLRLIPPDILEECLARIKDTLNKQVAADPDAERKAIADAFFSIRVLPADLKEYLGCELDKIAPAELVELRQLFTAIREGNTTWRDVMAEKRAEEKTVDNDPKDPKGATTLKDKLKAGAPQTQPIATEKSAPQTELPLDPKPTPTPAAATEAKPVPETVEGLSDAFDEPEGKEVYCQGKHMKVIDGSWKVLGDAPAAEAPKGATGRRQRNPSAMD